MFELLKKLKENAQLTRFKELHPTANVVVVVIAIIMFWRGVWGILDVILFPNSPLFSYGLSIVLGALVLYIDGFSVRDLKR